MNVLKGLPEVSGSAVHLVERPKSLCSLIVEVLCKVVDMDALGGFLAVLHSYKRYGQVSLVYLAQEAPERKVAEIVLHQPINRDDGLTILGHQKECSFHLCLRWCKGEANLVSVDAPLPRQRGRKRNQCSGEPMNVGSAVSSIA